MLSCATHRKITKFLLSSLFCYVNYRPWSEGNNVLGNIRPQKLVHILNSILFRLSLCKPLTLRIPDSYTEKKIGKKLQPLDTRACYSATLQARNGFRTDPEPILYLFRAEPILNQFWTNLIAWSFQPPFDYGSHKYIRIRSHFGSTEPILNQKCLQG